MHVDRTENRTVHVIETVPHKFRHLIRFSRQLNLIASAGHIRFDNDLQQAVGNGSSAGRHRNQTRCVARGAATVIVQGHGCSRYEDVFMKYPAFLLHERSQAHFRVLIIYIFMVNLLQPVRVGIDGIRHRPDREIPVARGKMHELRAPESRSR